MEINIEKTIKTLITRAKKEDKDTLNIAYNVINNLNSDNYLVENALNTVKSLNYLDIHHFLELLSLDHFTLNISKEYKNKLAI